MTEALYTQNTYNIMYVTSEEMQTMRPRMGASVIERTANLSEMSITILEPGTGEKVMVRPPISEETRRKMRETHLGKTLSLETRKKQSLAHTGQNHPMYGKHPSEETKKKQSDAKIGIIPWNKGLVGYYHPTEETRKKMSESQKGVIRGGASPETIQKLVESHKGQKPWNTGMKMPPRSEEIRRKISIGMTGKQNCLGHHLSDETKMKMSLSTVGKYSGEKCPAWRGGVSFEPYCEKFKPEFKERVREFFGRICVECGKTESENRKKLSVHHINYDKTACCDDIEPLFVALCCNCHTRTNHNREYWEQRYTEMIMTQFNGECYFHKKALNVDQIVNGG